MLNCKRCGESISQEQYDKYKRLCPACIRLNPIHQTENPGVKIAIVIGVIAVIVSISFAFWLIFMY